MAVPYDKWRMLSSECNYTDVREIFFRLHWVSFQNLWHSFEARCTGGNCPCLFLNVWLKFTGSPSLVGDTCNISSLAGTCGQRGSQSQQVVVTSNVGQAGGRSFLAANFFHLLKKLLEVSHEETSDDETVPWGKHVCNNNGAFYLWPHVA